MPKRNLNQIREWDGMDWVPLDYARHCAFIYAAFGIVGGADIERILHVVLG